jgi:hypothetical protein
VELFLLGALSQELLDGNKTKFENEYSTHSPQQGIYHYRARLAGLSLMLSGAKILFFTSKQVVFSATRFDLTTRQLEIGKLSLNGGDVNVDVDQEGN